LEIAVIADIAVIDDSEPHSYAASGDDSKYDSEYDTDPVLSREAAVVGVKGRKKDTYSYVGRNGKYGNTYFGNPYEIGEDGTRDEVLEMYKPHLAGLLATDEGQAELGRVRKDVEAGLPLGCHCAGKDGTPKVLTAEDPLHCHAQLVLIALEESGYEEEF
jgi:hypothetical protein